MDLELVKILSQFGLAGVMLAVLGTVVWRIGLRMISAIDRVGAKAEASAERMSASADASADRIADKLDLHTKTDIAAWMEVGTKLHGHFLQTSEDMAEFKQLIVEEFATLRRDLAVLGTRLDVVIDQRSAPQGVDEEHSRRTRIPRHDYAAQSGTPVVDRSSVRRPKRGQEDDK